MSYRCLLFSVRCRKVQRNEVAYSAMSSHCCAVHACVQFPVEQEDTLIVCNLVRVKCLSCCHFLNLSVWHPQSHRNDASEENVSDSIASVVVFGLAAIAYWLPPVYHCCFCDSYTCIWYGPAHTLSNDTPMSRPEFMACERKEFSAIIPRHV